MMLLIVVLCFLTSYVVSADIDKKYRDGYLGVVGIMMAIVILYNILIA